MEEQKFQMDFAGRPLVIEVGKLAKQASGAALVRYGDTAVFVTATGSKEAREDADFFPLTVDYEEKMYSCLLYTSPSPRDLSTSRMPSSA